MILHTNVGLANGAIGAINAALIAGNRREARLARLRQFWRQVEQRWPSPGALTAPGLASLLSNAATVMAGLPAFFQPNKIWT